MDPGQGCACIYLYPNKGSLSRLWFCWPWHSLGMGLHMRLLGSSLMWVRLALGIARVVAVASLWWVVGREMWLLGLIISVGVLITTTVTEVAHTTTRASLIVELKRREDAANTHAYMHFVFHTFSAVPTPDGRYTNSKCICTNTCIYTNTTAQLVAKIRWTIDDLVCTAKRNDNNILGSCKD